jgi:hypothetical protein
MDSPHAHTPARFRALIEPCLQTAQVNHGSIGKVAVNVVSPEARQSRQRTDGGVVRYAAELRLQIRDVGWQAPKSDYIFRLGTILVDLEIVLVAFQLFCCE